MYTINSVSLTNWRISILYLYTLCYNIIIMTGQVAITAAYPTLIDIRCRKGNNIDKVLESIVEIYKYLLYD